VTHIDEHTLELFVLDSSEIENRRTEIEAHLKECAGCAALHQEMMEYYNQVEQIRDKRAQATSQALTVRSMLVKTDPFAAPLSEIPKTVPARVVLFIIRHPAVSSISVAALFALALLTPTKTLFRDSNPAYARAKEEFLVVYNKEGGELWRKHIGVGYDWKELQYPADSVSLSRPPDQYLRAEDLDNDGTNEVVAIFGFGQGWPDRNAVVCFKPDGSERWKFEFSRKMIFGNEPFADVWNARQMIVSDFGSKDTKDIIASFDHGAGYYPQAIVRLDGATGRSKSEYWHSGTLLSIVTMDIENDGAKELICVGENNGFDMASMVVFDSPEFSGHAPAPPAYTPQEIPDGNEKYYVLFPRNDLKAVASHKRNIARSILAEGTGKIKVDVVEEVGRSGYTILYHFNSQMECTGVDGEDRFVTFHRKLEAEGKLTKKLDDAYWEELRRSVLYWDGAKSRFVSFEELSKTKKSGMSPSLDSAH